MKKYSSLILKSFLPESTNCNFQEENGNLRLLRPSNRLQYFRNNWKEQNIT